MPASLLNRPTNRSYALRRLLPLLILAALAGLYGLIQYRNYRPVFRETDTDGYVFLTKSFAHGRLPLLNDPDLFIHRSHFWIENPRGQITVKFAPGYPLLMVPFYLLGGDNALNMLNPILGGLSLIGAYLLFRQWLAAIPSLFAVAVLGITPMYQFYTGYPLTHSADIFFTTWGMFFLWKWMGGGNESGPVPAGRSAIAWGLGAGLMFGYAASVRYTSALLAIPIFLAAAERLGLVEACWNLVRRRGTTQASVQVPASGTGSAASKLAQSAVPMNCETAGDSDRHDRLRDKNRSAGRAARSSGFLGQIDRAALLDVAALLTPYILCGLLIAIYNWAVYGGPLQSGYAFTNEQATFNLQNFYVHAPILNHGLAEQLPLTFAVGLIGLVCLGNRNERNVRLGWFLSIYLIYACYYWGGAHSSYYRFMLATFPLLVGCTFMAIDRLPAGAVPRYAAMILVVAVAGLDAVKSLTAGWTGQMYAGDIRTVEAADELARTVRPDAVIFASQPLCYGVASRKDYRVYDLMAFDPDHRFDEFHSVDTPRAQESLRNRMIDAYGSADRDTLLSYEWTRIGRYLGQSRQVVFMIPTRQLRARTADLAPEFRLNELAQWASPHGDSWAIYEVHQSPPIPATNSLTTTP